MKLSDDIEFNPRLCLGIIFALAVTAKRPTSADYMKKDHYSYANFYVALFKILKIDYGTPGSSTINKYVKHLRTCIHCNGRYPFRAGAEYTAFKNEFNTNYDSMLGGIRKLLDDYIVTTDAYSADWLYNALLNVAEEDETLAGREFFILSNTEKTRLEDIRTLKPELPNLFLGLIHYCLLNVSNVVGEETAKALFFQNPNNRNYYELRPEAKLALGEVKESENKTIKSPFTIKVSDNIIPVQLGKSELKGIPVTPENLIKARQFSKLIKTEIIDSYRYLLNEKSNPEPFKDYLKNIYQEECNVNTILYTANKHVLKDFYVPNKLLEVQKIVKELTLSTPFIPHSLNVMGIYTKQHILITGVGAMGKTMMLRHFISLAVDSYEDEEYPLLPLFASLMQYEGDSFENAEEFLYENYKKHDGPGSLEDFKNMLIKGCFLILLDGLDEIKAKNFYKFVLSVNKFVKKYPYSKFCITSRPSSSLGALRNFWTYEICPFTKEQAVEMIKKLNYLPERPEVTTNFVAKLEEELFDKYKSFAGVPMLLTLMLMMWHHNSSIPLNIADFYRQAFEVLAYTHDRESKGLIRELASADTVEHYADCFAEFCAVSYFSGKFGDFSKADIVKLYDSLEWVASNSDTANGEKFIEDTVDRMSLMIKEGDIYNFYHRTFQEYFAARYLVEEKVDALYAVCEYLNKTLRKRNDENIFSMLYSIKKSKIEKYVFLPYLDKIFKECKYSYFEFLKIHYKTIHYTPLGAISKENTIDSYILRFILKNVDMNNFDEFYYLNGSYVNLPYYEDFVTVQYTDFHGEIKLEDLDDEELSMVDFGSIDVEDIKYYPKLQPYVDPDTIDHILCEFDIDTILSNPEEYQEMIEALGKSNCRFKAEFNALCRYHEWLKDTYDNKLLPILSIIKKKR